MTEYAVRYPTSTVYDPSWRCVADVVASFHGGYYCDEAGRVTGVLLRRVAGGEWEAVA